MTIYSVILCKTTNIQLSYACRGVLFYAVTLSQRKITRGVLFYAVTLSQRKITRHDAHIKFNRGRDVFFYRVTKFVPCGKIALERHWLKMCLSTDLSDIAPPEFPKEWLLFFFILFFSD